MVSTPPLAEPLNRARRRRPRRFFGGGGAAGPGVGWMAASREEAEAPRWGVSKGLWETALMWGDEVVGLT